MSRPLVSIAQTKNHATYVYLEECKWKTTRIKKEMPSYKVACLEGITVYKKDISSLKERAWISDSVIDFMFKYYSLQMKRENQVDIFHPYPSYFHQRLLINGSMFQKPLDLSGCNIGGVKRWTPRNLHTYQCVLVPICDMTHWWLVVYTIPTGQLHVLCSMGWQRNVEAESVKRYFEQVRLERSWPSEIPQIAKPTFPKVAKQTNGYDCGVFVIEYGKRIMQGGEIGPDLVKTEEVQKRRKYLKKLIEEQPAN